jgi:hypothetical protein
MFPNIETIIIKNMKESELFELLKNKYVQDLTKSEDTYSHFDCYSKIFKIFVELKCRGAHYDKLMIEKYKYDRLIELAAQKNYTPYYINSTPNGVYAFKLVVEPEWSEKDLPKTTEFENNNLIKKIVGYLDIKIAKKIF